GKAAARKAGSRAKTTARQARKAPGVSQAEGAVKGAVASEDDLAIPDYDSKNASEIVTALTGLSQIDLGKVDAYERRHESRATILRKIGTLRGPEPWPGYDELTVDEVRNALGGDHGDEANSAREYERRHKSRAGVLEAADREEPARQARSSAAR
nr:hypothetical protein [Thermoleophilaceae bacterium]